MLRKFYSTARKTFSHVYKPNVHYNLSYPDLFHHEVRNREGKVFQTNDSETFGVSTGKFTGRSPGDKWIVKDEFTEKNIWWGKVNQPISSEVFDDLYETAVNHMNDLHECYIFDGYCGANKSTQRRVRFIHEQSWQQHFVKNMFIPKDNDDVNFEPDFTIINACSATNQKWREHGLNSEVAIGFNISREVGVILGTWYGGENKKGIFSLMNYWLPLENIMTMHCSANVGKKGDSALFFGLSGTGKTTLSTDPERFLIGDDEHGWDDDGIFNFEGGCYAKTINLSRENEPDIYNAIRKNALLENTFQKENGEPDYDDTSITENGRVSYPINHIPNWHRPQTATHPKTIIFLTCDAFGVLPPVAKLSNGQAMYHFLSGYTAKVAGTERGVTEPQATFSACFGEAFLTLHPTKYAELLEKKLEQHNCNVFLVNTGWSGGGYLDGERMKLKHTRECISEILNGNIYQSDFIQDPVFKFHVPTKISYLDSSFCIPKNSWKDSRKYDDAAFSLANMFVNNYQKYVSNDVKDYSMHGPILRI